MAGAFPASVTIYTNPTATSRVDVAVGGRTLDQFIADLCDDIEQVETKLGTGTSSPVANTVLRGTGIGTSGYGQVQTADVAAGAITGSGSAQANSAVNISSLTYVDVMTLAYTSFGGDLLLLATSDGYILSGTPGDFYLSVRNDTDTDIDLINQPGAATPKQWVATRRVTGVAAGSHTIAMRGLVGGAGTIQTFRRSLIVLEFKK